MKKQLEVSSSTPSCNWYRRNIYKERHTYRIVVSDLGVEGRFGLEERIGQRES
ncbi:MAG: hypothetical protein HS132_07110 [Planctomycetia bacterium]|nr:hypothetical protein [Planctomycetia bacterium]